MERVSKRAARLSRSGSPSQDDHMPLPELPPPKSLPASPDESGGGGASSIEAQLNTAARKQSSAQSSDLVV